MSKTKTKMKSGTIAVIALSIVLVLSLITTITLAYFTASRNVITTIQFASGVKLQMAGAYTQAASSVEDTPPSIGPVTLYWKAYYGSQGGTAISTEDSTTGTYSEIAEKMFFDDLKVRVLDLDSYVAVRVAVRAFNTTTTSTTYDMTGNGQSGLGSNYVQPMMASTWMAYTGSTSTSSNSYGWFVYKGATNAAAKMTKAGAPVTDNPNPRDSTAGFQDIITGWALEPDNDFAGKTLVCTVTVFAANTEAGLAEEIDAFNANVTGEAQQANYVNVSTYDTTNQVGYAAAYVAPAQGG